MKKFILTFIGIIIYLFSIAQKPEFFGSFEYYTHNSIKLEQKTNLPLGNDLIDIIHDQGKMNLAVGIKYSPITNLSVMIKTDTYMNYNSIDSYTPVQANYTVKINFKISKNLQAYWKHQCIHPIKTSNYNHTEMFGGHTCVGISFNTKNNN